MSETLETRRTRLAALDGRDWQYGACRRCSAERVVYAAGQEGNVLCGACRITEASLATAISRLPAVPPSPVVGSGSGFSGPENGSQAVDQCPVCAATQREPLCTFTGHVPPVPPELVCMQYCGHPLPTPVYDLDDVAILAGWRTEVRHSRGRVMGGNGKQLAAADVWSVRMHRGTWMAYAVRRGDVWQSVCITGAALPPFLALGVTELREWLADPDGCGPAWVDKIRGKVAASELHKKLVRCPGAPLCVLHGPDVKVGPDHTHRADGAIVKKVSRKEAQAGL